MFNEFSGETAKHCELVMNQAKLPSFKDCFLLRLNRKEDRADFQVYCEKTMSYFSMALVFSVLGLHGVHFLIVSVTRTIPNTILMSLFCTFGLWIICFGFLLHIHCKKNLSKFHRDASTIIENLLMVLGSVGIGLGLMYRVLNGECETLNYNDLWHCNPNARSRSLPQDVMMMLLLYPVFFPCVFKSIRLKTVVFCWLCNIILIITAIHIPDEPLFVSYMTMSFFVPATFILICDLQRQNLSTYFMSCQQKFLLQENVRLAEESHVEMRHMIGNVAHDLKTPLASLQTAIEMISSNVTALHITIEHNSPLNNNKYNDDDDEAAVKLSDIESYLSDVRNVNAFMLMTINRCIDFTKASNGFKLVPIQETIKLSDVLHLPLKCMNDMQSTVTVALQKLSSNICSHIITDKQWLQENILCLLSNAVKYSNGGEVTVNVTLVQSSQDEAAINERRLQVIAEQKAARELSTSLRLSSRKQTNNSAPLSTSTVLYTAGGLDKTVQPPPPTAAPRPDVLVLTRSISKGGRYKIGASVSPENPTVSFPAATSPHAAAIGRNEAKNDKAMLMFEVEDTGIGISDGMKASLFAPFKQAQRQAGGTGLGLFSLARRVEALGGFYGVENRKDGLPGSLFWFTIPYRPDRTAGLMSTTTSAAVSPNSSCCNLTKFGQRSATDSAIAVLTTTAITTAAVSTLNASLSEARLMDIPAVKKASLRMLVVDDSLAILKMTSMMLRKQGHTVTQAKNGAEALEILNKALLTSTTDAGTVTEFGDSKTVFDVVLMDLQMPVMDGLEATRRYREVEKETNQTRSAEGKTELHQLMISFSANSDDVTMSEALAVGFDAFISKPFTLETFNNVCAKFMAVV